MLSLIAEKFMLNWTLCPGATDPVFLHLNSTWPQAKVSIRTWAAKLLIPIDLDESPARRKSDVIYCICIEKMLCNNSGLPYAFLPTSAFGDTMFIA